MEELSQIMVHDILYIVFVLIFTHIISGCLYTTICIYENLGTAVVMLFVLQITGSGSTLGGVGLAL